MVEAIVVFGGWHPELSQAEFHAMCPKVSIKTTASPRIIVVNGDIDTDAISTHSSAEGLLFDGGLFRYSSHQDSVDRIKSLVTVPSGSVEVRAWRHEGKIPESSINRLEIDVGAHLFASGCKVDLESPANTLAIIIDGKSGLVAFGWLHSPNSDSRDWSSRVASKRPFFKPVSLEPRLARCAVNLACGDRDGTFIDPMCGTGGFLIESAVTGRDTFGFDIEGKMVAGSRQNLSHFGLKAEVVKGDVTTHLIEKQIAGIAVDPPYGRNSHGSSDKETLMLAMLSNLRSQVKDQTGLVMIIPVIDGVAEMPPLALCDWNIEAEFVIPVHGSLARKLILARASPRD